MDHLTFGQYIRKLDTNLIFDNLLDGKSRHLSESLFIEIEDERSSCESIKTELESLDNLERELLFSLYLKPSLFFRDLFEVK